ncbi:rhodanese-like domain-containing protein [Nostocoides veronense]|uniref:Rhodanese-like domain-containing protein n=1 Tax=Nostocoides veronense TaxID=330836 RepID=A0ABN2M3X1_9MICO
MSRQPGEPLHRTAKDLVDAAMERIETIPLAQAEALLDDPDVLIVDIRDPRELEKLGTIRGAYSAPRGMLEFWIDPASPYYKPVLDDGRKLVLYCGSAWRSALATAVLNDMGRTDVAHLEGGFTAWSKAGLPVEPHQARRG